MGLFVLTAQADVNIVSDLEDYHVNPLITEFTKETGIKVNTVFLEEGTLTARAAAKPEEADLYFANDIASMVNLDSTGKLQPMTGNVINDVPKHFISNNKTYLAISYRGRTMVYPPSRIDASDLTGYSDLANPKYKGRVCIRPLLHSYNIALVSEMLASEGEEYTQKWLNGLVDNLAVRPTGNDRHQAKLVSTGVCDLALMNTYYRGLMLKNDTQRVFASNTQLFFPDQKEKGTYVLYSGAGIAKGAKHRNEAQKLIDFILSKTGQTIISNVTFEYPVMDNIPLPTIVQEFGSGQPGVVTGKAKFNFVSPKDIAANREKAVEMLTAVSSK